ncbi:MAG: hypothetical protein ACJAT4_001405 [Granulosicoccus sp.]|jgi:hypothetical protein
MLKSLFKNYAKKSADIFLSKILIHSQQKGEQLNNILTLESTITGSIKLLKEKKQQTFYELLKSDQPILLVKNFDALFDNLIKSFFIFYKSGNLDAFLLSKLVEEFLLDSNYQKKQDVENVTKSEKIVYSKEINSVMKESTYQRDQYDYDDWKFGTKYKKRLGLSQKEVDLLNRIYIGGTVFTEIQQGADESARFYLRAVNGLEKFYEAKGVNLFKKIAHIDKVKRAFTRTDYGHEYWYNPSDNIFRSFFKLCENAVREKYSHKRKLDESFYTSDFGDYLTDISGQQIRAIIGNEIDKIAPPLSESVIKLNALNRTRWTIEFNEIKAKVKEYSAKELLQSLNKLCELNIENTSLSKIYFDSFKLLIEVNKIAALKFYLQYYHSVSKTIKTKIKQISAAQMKKLFKNEEQVADFKQIVWELSTKKDLLEAVKKLPSIYATKKKAIKLDVNAISQIKEMHSETVGKLNELLEESDEEIIIETSPKPDSEKQKEPASPDVLEGLDAIFDLEDDDDDETLNFKDYQVDFIRMVIANDCEISSEVVNQFSKEKGVFRNQLINGINETFYEVHEDNLLEESENGYQLYEEYVSLVTGI